MVGEDHDAALDEADLEVRAGVPALVLHRLAVLAVPVLVGWLALYDLQYVGSRWKPSALRHVTDLATSASPAPPPELV